MEAKKENKGHNWKGAGRPPTYSEKTKPKAFRIPISKMEEVTKVVNEMLLSYARKK